MAGHSHSKNIMHRKNAVDSKRGKLFSKLAKNIISAARQGAEPDTNLTLKYAIEKAKQGNMPKENIDRAIKRGSGQLEGEVLEDILYEGYGPEGTALLVQSCTSNKNRTAPAVRALFDRGGGNLGTSGSVSWMFKHRAVFLVEESASDEETLMDLVLENGGDDVQNIGGSFEVSGPSESFGSLVEAFDKSQIPTQAGELAWIADNTIPIADEATAQKIMKLIEALEDNEDVTAVHCNWDVSEDILEKL